jgi:uridine kinase
VAGPAFSLLEMIDVSRSRCVDVEELLGSVEPKAGTTKIVAIDGHGGSGKSTLAKLLARTLGAAEVHTDDFASWDNPKDWWPRLIEQVLEPIASGVGTLNYPRSDWWGGHNRAPVIDEVVTPVMILEGVSSLRHELRPYISLGILVATPPEICLERGILRDKGMGTAEQITERWSQYFNDEVRYMTRDHPEEFARILVDGTRPFQDQLRLR